MFSCIYYIQSVVSGITSNFNEIPSNTGMGSGALPLYLFPLTPYHLEKIALEPRVV